MVTETKKVIAIHDMVGFGRASLTNIIPVLSCMGVQVCPVPTAVFSAHTTFPGPSCVDLSENMGDILTHWREQEFVFDCIYSGYLATVEQIEAVRDFFETFGGENTLIALDPVMGDNGKLYSKITPEMIDGMKSMIKYSDVIFPNFTEACFLLGEKYRENYDISSIKGFLRGLSDYGSDTVIIKGAPLIGKENLINVFAYERHRGEYYKFTAPKLEGSYPGTGDIFASAVIGGLLQGRNIAESIANGMDFISICIEYTRRFSEPKSYGVMFEKNLGKLQNFKNNIEIKII